MCRGDEQESERGKETGVSYVGYHRVWPLRWARSARASRRAPTGAAEIKSARKVASRIRNAIPLMHSQICIHVRLESRAPPAPCAIFESDNGIRPDGSTRQLDIFDSVAGVHHARPADFLKLCPKQLYFEDSAVVTETIGGLSSYLLSFDLHIYKLCLTPRDYLRTYTHVIKGSPDSSATREVPTRGGLRPSDLFLARLPRMGRPVADQVQGRQVHITDM
ncbi:hypothetical protein EVAR_30064_1 [Eumeta japonica]|uniref:Uncharacterized protein n=1 Tax=Eumeta variegata TaxID=151549 RepID=A0A4C1XCC2_EUMVA|nr:hypothetical protein EVAR_30064_1 [Eumeta japonica]